jgi:hypothetical protein
MATPSDLVAAADVPERQREEAERQEEEEGVEHEGTPWTSELDHQARACTFQEQEVRKEP